MSFGGSIKLQGATEYQQALNNITKNLQVMSSEMKVVTSTFSKNQATSKNLTEVNNALNKRLVAQKEAVANLEKILAKAKSQYGEDSEQVRKLTIELNNSKSAVNKTESAIKNNNETLKAMKKSGADNVEELKKFEKASDSAKEHSKNFADVLKANLLSGALLNGLNSLVNGLQNVAGKFMDSLKASAEYGDSIDKNSQKVGLSAQAYQEWDYVMQRSGTSMEASSAGFKTLTTKLGQAESGSKTAVASFSKLGLSMDDLKGKSREEVFAMTVKGLQGVSDETERARLATELFGKSGQNLMPMLNQSSASTEELIENYRKLGGAMSDDAVKASAEFEDNLTDIQAGMQGIVRNGIGQLLPFINDGMKGFLAIIQGNAEEGTKMIASAVTGLGQKIADALPSIIQGASDIITSIMDTLDQNMPEILKGGTKIIETLCNGLATNLPKLVSGASQLILTLAQGIITNLPLLLQSAIQIVVQLANSISQNLPTLIPVMVDAVIQMAQALIDNISLLVDAALQLVIALAQGVIQALPELLKQAPKIIGELAGAIVKNLPTILKTAVQLIGMLVKGIIQSIPQVIAVAPRIIAGFVSSLANGIPSMGKMGLNLIKGLWNGINDATQWIIDKIGGFTKKVLKSIKSFFGIHSPSTVMKDEVGKYLALGLGEGFTDQMDAVNQQMHSAVDLNFGTATIRNVASGSSSISSGGTNLVSAFREAMQGMQVVLDDEKAGEFVIRTVSRQVFA